jgi:hypothetical protein
LAGQAARPADSLASYLVDLAKAEALDAMGENRKAVELLERHV